MKTKIIKLLVFLSIINTDGFDRNGTPTTTGANKYNPLSYIVGLPLILLIAFSYFLKGIKEGWDSIF
jgi:hypothetical protein